MAQNSVQIVTLSSKTKKFELGVHKLRSILLREDLKNRELVVISIAGASRKGKSFLLNFFLRYLNERYVRKNFGANWLQDDEDKQLDGFRWSGGVDPVTCGIHMWNEVFFHDFNDGRKVAVVLIDTQGTFDHKTTLKDCTMIFALSILLSSVQIFNIMQSIQENDLQHLQLFSEYGRLAASSADAKPFQKLLLLVRDWPVPYQFSYGSEGGEQYLQKCFDCTDRSEEEHKSLREHIQGCFDDISCFLMPHPGMKVSSSQHFEGNLKDIDEEFKNHLNLLIPQLLAPENLILKKIDGRPLSGEVFVKYFEQYFSAFENEVPSPMTIMDANAKVRNDWIVKEVEKLYAGRMTLINCKLREYVDKLQSEHALAKEETSKFLAKNPLIGSAEMKIKYQSELESSIEEIHQVLIQNHYQNELLLVETKEYYSAKVRNFDAELGRYTDLLRTVHEIGKRRSFEKLEEKLKVASSLIMEMFKSELISHIRSDYQLLIQDQKNNERSVKLSEESYLARLALFHCGIDQYIDKIKIEHEAAKERASELLRTNFLRGNLKMIERFEKKLQEFFKAEFARFITTHNRNIEVVKECKNIYLARVHEVDPNSWMYVRSLNSEHVAAKLEALQLFEKKIPNRISRMYILFKQRLETSIDEQLQRLLGRCSSWNPMSWLYNSWLFVKPHLLKSVVASASAGIAVVASPIELPAAALCIGWSLIAGAVALLTSFDYSSLWRRQDNRQRQLIR